MALYVASCSGISGQIETHREIGFAVFLIVTDDQGRVVGGGAETWVKNYARAQLKCPKSYTSGRFNYGYQIVEARN